MNRRGFLASMLASAMAPAVVRAESIMRIRPIVLPGEGEFDALMARVAAHSSINAFLAREALQILEAKLHFPAAMDRKCALPVASGRITIRRPALYAGSLQ